MHQSHIRRIPSRLAFLLPLFALAGCAVPGVQIVVQPDRLVAVTGGRATVTLIGTPFADCRDEEPRFCPDPTGIVFDYVAQNLPAGVTVSFDTSLRSPSTPGLVRVTFHVADEALPNQYNIVMHALAPGGTVLGTGTVALHVLPAGGTTPAPNAQSIAAGPGFSLAVLTDGRVRSWGTNYQGRLGVGDQINRYRPFRISDIDEPVVSLAAGFNHALALSANGNVWAWGESHNGQLGDGSVGELPRVQPGRVPGLQNVTAVAAGDTFSLALVADGSVWWWGTHRGMQRPAPVQVANLPRAGGIAAGQQTAMAIAVDGTVWTWGTVIGADEPEAATAMPIQVIGLDGIQSIAVRRDSAVALDDEGQVWAWGDNAGGQLGDGTANDRAAPALVEGLESVTAIALGSEHAIALTADGTVWNWGSNLGAQDRTRGLPERVPGLSGVRAIASGSAHNLAVVACGQIWAWGGNEGAAFGDDSIFSSIEPTLVADIGDDAGCERVALRVNVIRDAGALGSGLTLDPGILRWDGHLGFNAIVDRGTQVALTTLADYPADSGDLFAFDGWAIDCSGTNPRVSILMDRTKRCTAHYRQLSPDPFVLSIGKQGVGRVTSSGGGVLGPEAIDCGTTCDAVFPGNSVVSLSATGSGGFGFTGWTVDCHGSAAQTTVTIDRRKSCHATFTPFELAVLVTGEGTVTSDPDGLDCTGTCSFTPRAGTATLRATPAAGWQFDAWGGDCTGSTSQTVVTMDADKSCTARFSRTTGFFFLTMIVEGEGSVTSTPAGINCPGTCVALLPAQTAVVVTSHPPIGHMVSFWLDDCAGPGEFPTRTIVMNADKQCRIQFTGRPAFPIASFALLGGAPRVGEIVTFDGNASHVFDPVTNTPHPAGITSFAWDFDGDGTFTASGGRSAAAIAQYAFQAAGDHTVRLRVRGGPFDLSDDDEQIVTVEPASGALFGLTVNKAGAGEGAIGTNPRGLIECRFSCAAAGPLLLEPDTVVTLTAAAEPGSNFAGWSGAGCTGSTTSIQVTMTAARTCTATFVPVSPGPFVFTVNMNAPVASIGSVIAVAPPSNPINCRIATGFTCAATFPAGTVVVVRPSDSSVELGLFGGWSGCDSVSGLFACTVTLNGDRTVTASFAR